MERKKQSIQLGKADCLKDWEVVFPLPDILKVTAEAEDGDIMAVEHTEYPVFGVQFHPESVMTPDGKIMVENFMKITK